MRESYPLDALPGRVSVAHFGGWAVMPAWWLQPLSEAVRDACVDSRPERRGLGWSPSKKKGRRDAILWNKIAVALDIAAAAVPAVFCNFFILMDLSKVLPLRNYRIASTCET